MELNVSEETHLRVKQICLRSIHPALGTGHYLSPGVGGQFFWGGSLVKRTKGGSVVTENPKGEITENFGRIQGGKNQIFLENEDMGWGIAKVIKYYSWGSLH